MYCLTPLCHTFISIWTEKCNVLGIETIECGSAIQKPLCACHYLHFVNASKIVPVFCQICRVKYKHSMLLLLRRSLYYALMFCGIFLVRDSKHI